MIPGLILGFGIGLAAYGSMKLLFGRPFPHKLPGLRHSQNLIHQKHSFIGSSGLEPLDENFGDRRTGKGAASETLEGSGCLEFPEVEHDPENECGREMTESKEVAESNNWFLIRTSQGTLRACQCTSRTSRTIAGPFESKLAAYEAKQRFSALTTRSPRL